jgi:hypothetical protein
MLFYNIISNFLEGFLHSFHAFLKRKNKAIDGCSQIQQAKKGVGLQRKIIKIG